MSNLAAVPSESSDRYRTKDVDLLKQIVESGEARLQAQLTIALASDLRALTLAGFLAAAVVALIGGAATLMLSTPSQHFLGYTALITALGLLGATGLAVFAARPVAWSSPGTRPEIWVSDIKGQKAEDIRLAELAADIERKTEENATAMSGHGKALNIALLIAIGSLALGGGLFAGYFIFQQVMV